MPAILRLIPYLLVSLCLAVGVAPTHAQENRNYTTYLEQFYDVVDYPMFVNPELVLSFQFYDLWEENILVSKCRSID